MQGILTLDNTSSLSANVRPVQPWQLFSEYILSRQRQRTPQGTFSSLMHRYTSRADYLHITSFMLGSFVSCSSFLHSFHPHTFSLGSPRGPQKRLCVADLVPTEMLHYAEADSKELF